MKKQIRLLIESLFDNEFDDISNKILDIYRFSVRGYNKIFCKYLK